MIENPTKCHECGFVFGSDRPLVTNNEAVTTKPRECGIFVLRKPYSGKYFCSARCVIDYLSEEAPEVLSDVATDASDTNE